jgi:hypothetical protein
MKNKFLQMLLLVFALLSVSACVQAQIEKTFVGEWNFECPGAPDGFNTGIIEIKKDTVFTQYSSFTYKFPSTWVKISNDTLIYPTDVNGELVISRLVAKTFENLTGTAGTLDGLSSLILTRRTETLSESRK